MLVLPAVVEPLVQASQHDLAGAETSLRRALATEPGNAAASLNLGLLLAETGRTGDAEAALRAAATADPTLAVAHYNLCALLARDRPREAVPHCARASALRPDDARYLQALQFARRAARPAAQAPRP